MAVQLRLVKQLHHGPVFNARPSSCTCRSFVSQLRRRPWMTGGTHRWHALFRARQFRHARLVLFSFFSSLTGLSPAALPSVTLSLMSPVGVEEVLLVWSGLACGACRSAQNSGGSRPTGPTTSIGCGTRPRGEDLRRSRRISSPSLRAHSTNVDMCAYHLHITTPWRHAAESDEWSWRSGEVVLLSAPRTLQLCMAPECSAAAVGVPRASRLASY